MLKVFNCGIGFCLIADKDVSDQIIAESEEIIQMGNIQKNMRKILNKVKIMIFFSGSDKS